MQVGRGQPRDERDQDLFAAVVDVQPEKAEEGEGRSKAPVVVGGMPEQGDGAKCREVGVGVDAPLPG